MDQLISNNRSKKIKYEHDELQIQNALFAENALSAIIHNYISIQV